MQDLTGNKVEKVMELANIALNKNTVPGDRSALTPSGIRIGLQWLAGRPLHALCRRACIDHAGLQGGAERLPAPPAQVQADFERVADLLHRGIEITGRVQKQTGEAAPASPLSAHWPQAKRWSTSRRRCRRCRPTWPSCKKRSSPRSARLAG